MHAKGSPSKIGAFPARSGSFVDLQIYLRRQPASLGQRGRSPCSAFGAGGPVILAQAWAVAHTVAWSGVQVEISGGRCRLGGQLKVSGSGLRARVVFLGLLPALRRFGPHTPASSNFPPCRRRSIWECRRQVDSGIRRAEGNDPTRRCDESERADSRRDKWDVIQAWFQSLTCVVRHARRKRSETGPQ